MDLSGEHLLWPVFAYCGIVTFNGFTRLLTGWLDRRFPGCHRPISFIGTQAMRLLVSHGLIHMTVTHYSRLSPIKTFILIEVLYLLILTPFILYSSKGTRAA